MSPGDVPVDEPKIRVGYDQWAPIYDHDANPLQALEGPVVRRLLGDVGGLSVLDLGCGTGRHALSLASRGAVVTALDFSEGMLSQARGKPQAESVRFLAHDLGEALPFDPESFDRIVSGLVLEHLPPSTLEVFYDEAHRVLRRGGIAVISAMHPAMMLRGTQARFTDPDSGEIIQPGSYDHRICDLLMPAIRAGFTLTNLEEHAPDADLADRFPRAEKYRGWPMLLALVLERR